MALNRRVFFNEIRPLFGGRLNQLQVEGMDAILNFWERHNPNGDPRWLAYMFATTFHETNATMQPVREAYWLSENWRRRNLPYYPYYGRGYVQLTHQGNYRRAGAFVGADLVRNPDLAMLPDHAATIMYFGMEAGWFRGDPQGRRHKLDRYFNRSVNDPVGARDIINGREWKSINGRRVLLATVIARYHDTFLRAINAAAQRALPRGFEPAHSPYFTEGPLIGNRDFGPDMPMADMDSGLFDDGFSEDVFAPETADFALTPDEMTLSSRGIEPFDQPMDEESRLLDHTIEIVTAFLDSGNIIAPAEVAELISSVHTALVGLSVHVPYNAPEDSDLTEEEYDSAPDPEPKPKATTARKRSRSTKSKEYEDGPSPKNV